MKYENMIGKTFNSFQQRIIYSYAVVYPDFFPNNDIDIGVEEQKQLYTFLRGMIETIYENLEILGFKAILPDDCYDGEAAKEKPHIYTNMKNIEKKLFNLYTLIIDINDKGEVKNNSIYVKKSDLSLDKNKLQRLSQIKLQSKIENDNVIIWSDEYPNIFHAFPFLIKNIYENEKLNIKKFIYCIFNDKAVASHNMYKNFIEKPENISGIENYLDSLGYKNGFCDGGRIGFYKEYPNKQQSSFLSRFDPRQRNQLSFEVHVPNFRILLQHYNEMDKDLQHMSYTRLKICDNCGYCTQTDKSGKRKPVAMELTYGDEIKNKCPLYPWFIWNDIDGGTMRSIIKLFDFSEKMNSTV